MSIEKSPDSYAPQPLWEPSFIDEDIVNKVQDLNAIRDRFTQMPTEVSQLMLLQERRVAHELSNISSTYQIGNKPRNSLKSSPIYRAELAEQKGHGNCISHTEVVTAVSKALNLPTLMMWGIQCFDGDHANNLLIGEEAIHEVDAFFNFNRVLSETTNEPDEAMAATARHISTYGGYAYLALPFSSDQRDNDQDMYIQSAYNPKLDLAKTFVDQNYDKKILIIMDPDYGINMLGALGDKKRYQQTKPELYKQFGEQIMSYIPPLRTDKSYNQS